MPGNDAPFSSAFAAFKIPSGVVKSTSELLLEEEDELLLLEDEEELLDEDELLLLEDEEELLDEDELLLLEDEEELLDEDEPLSDEEVTEESTEEPVEVSVEDSEDASEEDASEELSATDELICSLGIPSVLPNELKSQPATKPAPVVIHKLRQSIANFLSLFAIKIPPINNFFLHFPTIRDNKLIIIILSSFQK